MPKNWCFGTVVLEKTLESPLDCKKIKPVNPKGNQLWIFIGWTDAEAPVLWPPDAKSWLEKTLRLGNIWGQDEKQVKEDEMLGWHHNSMDMGLSKLWEIVKDREALCATVQELDNLGITDITDTSRSIYQILFKIRKCYFQKGLLSQTKYVQNRELN